MIGLDVNGRLDALMERVDELAAEAFVAGVRDATRKYPHIVRTLRDRADLLDLERHIGPLIRGTDEEELIEAVMSNLAWEQGELTLADIRADVRALIADDLVAMVEEHMAWHIAPTGKAVLLEARRNG